MGHTHYWQRPAVLPADRFGAAAADVRRLLPTLNVVLAGPLGEGPAVLEEDRIAFNGAGPEGCESFEICQIEAPLRQEQRILSFCKTQRRPYDLAVRAALIVLKHHLRPDLHVSSDADQKDWDKAEHVVRHALGYAGPVD